MMYRMAYFYDRVPKLYIGSSADLLKWSPENCREAADVSAAGQILRDPSLIRDREGIWHVFYTTGWTGATLGHMTSANLTDFRIGEAVIPFRGAEADDVENCWAPECYYDGRRDRYVLIWSTSFRRLNGIHEYSNRIWSMVSRDLVDWSKPRLFFDPGYTVIDATLLCRGGRWLMAFKDERDFNAEGSRFSAIRTAEADDIMGPYRNISEILTPWCSEGPVLKYSDGQYYIFYDSFREERYMGIASRDFRHWEDVSGEMRFPVRGRHLFIAEE